MPPISVTQAFIFVFYIVQSSQLAARVTINDLLPNFVNLLTSKYGFDVANNYGCRLIAVNAAINAQCINRDLFF